MATKIPFENNDEDNVLFLLFKLRDIIDLTTVYNKYQQYLYVLAIRYLKN